VQVERIRRAIQLRTAPKREATPSVIADDLDEFRRGSMRITRLWEDLLDEDEALVTVKSKRFDGSSRLRWEILVDEDASDGTAGEAARHQEALQGFYSGLRATDVLMQDEVGGVGLLTRQILLAKATGFSTLEWIWKPASVASRQYTTSEFRRCPPWWFENRTGRLQFLLQDWDTNGVPMDPNGWLVAAAPALMRPSCVLWLYKNLSLRDWLAFSEKFGMPGLIGETTAEKGTPEWLTFKEALANFGPDWALLVNEGAKITPISVSAAASLLPYPPLIEMLTRSLYALWLGGDLSTLSAGTGQGQGASLQGTESAKIEDDDARFVSELCQQRIDRAVIEYTFGAGVQPLAYFKLCPPVRQNIAEEVKVDEFFAANGLAQERASLYGRYNRPLPDESDEVVLDTPRPAPAVPGAAPDLGEFPNEAPKAQSDAILRAIAADLAPVRQRLTRILGIEDPAIQRDKLAAFVNELPALLRDINADPASARQFEILIAQATVRGLKQGGDLASVANGDVPGHPFHGNQHATGTGGAAAESAWSSGVDGKSKSRRRVSMNQASAALRTKGFELGDAEPWTPGQKATVYRVKHVASGEVLLRSAEEIARFIQ